MRKCLTTFSRIFEFGAVVFGLDSKGAKACKSCRSRQELSNEYLVFPCTIWRRYSRGRASQSSPNISQKLERRLEKTHRQRSVRAAEVGGLSGAAASLDGVGRESGDAFRAPQRSGYRQCALRNAALRGFAGRAALAGGVDSQN